MELIDLPRERLLSKLKISIGNNQIPLLNSPVTKRIVITKFMREKEHCGLIIYNFDSLPK